MSSLQLTKGRHIPAEVRPLLYTVATKYHVKVDEILGSSRARRVVQARYTAMRAMYPTYTFEAIGRIFNRHHTTVMYAVGSITKH